MSSFDIRSKISLDSSEFQAGLNRAKNAAGQFGSSLGEVKSLIGQAFAVTAIVELERRAIEAAVHIGEVAQNLGISTDALQAFTIAANRNGASTDAVTTALTKLKRAQGEAIDGDKKAIAAFDALGISQKQIAESSLEDLFSAVGDGLTKASNNAVAFNATIQLLGRSSGQLVSTLNEVSETGLAGLEASSKATGQVFRSEIIDVLKDAVDGLKALGNVVLNVFATITAAAVAGAENVKAFVGAVLNGGSALQAIKDIGSGKIGAGASIIEREDKKAAQEKLEAESRKATAEQAQAEAAAKAKEDIEKKAATKTAEEKKQLLQEIDRLDAQLHEKMVSRTQQIAELEKDIRKQREDEKSPDELTRLRASKQIYEDELKLHDLKKKDADDAAKAAKEAAKIAAKKADILSGEGVHLSAPHVDSLQRIGGFVGSSSDPLHRTLERQVKIQEEMRNYLRELARNKTPAGYGD